MTAWDHIVLAAHHAVTRLYQGNRLVRIATRIETKLYALARRCRTKNIREAQRKEWREAASRIRFDPEMIAEYLTEEA